MEPKDIIQKIDFLRVIENKEELPVYHEVALNIVNYLRNNLQATFQEIIKYVEGSDRRTLRLLNQMVNLGILKFIHPYFSLNKRKTAYPITINDVRCPYCDSKMVNIKGKMGEITSLTRKVFVAKPPPTFVFDQRPVNLETTIRRVAYAIWRGDLQGKKICIIGDDDLTSIPLGLTKMANEIVVFDIDKRILAYIKEFAKSHKLNITVVNQDLLKGVPSHFQKHFDVFMTDPTPTPKPFTLFANTGLQLLKKGKDHVGYVSLYPSHELRTIEFQKIMTKMEVIITDIIPFFTQYDFIRHTYSESDLELLKKYASSESKISFYEYLIRIETTAKTRPLKDNFSAADIIGIATKRVLSTPQKDPVLGGERKSEYVQKAAAELRKALGKNGK